MNEIQHGGQIEIPLKNGEFVFDLKSARRPRMSELRAVFGELPKELSGEWTGDCTGATRLRRGNRVCLVKDFGIATRSGVIDEWVNDLGYRCATFVETLSFFLTDQERRNLFANGTVIEYGSEGFLPHLTHSSRGPCFDLQDVAEEFAGNVLLVRK